MATQLVRIQLLAKPASEWALNDAVLLAGEIGAQDVTTSTPVLKMGDGVRPFSMLPNLLAPVMVANDYVPGVTTTLPPGSSATVVIDNMTDPPTISFGIPAGDTGPANTLTIGTVTASAPGAPADATITGTPPNQVLSLVIPRGDPGPKGDKGDQGDPGAPGGVPGVANPSATIGLVAINGVAATAMRSDGAPALSQAIVPTWTGAHRFNAVTTFGADLRALGWSRFCGWNGAAVSDPLGMAVEIGVVGSTGLVNNYNRSAGVYGPLDISGLSLNFQTNGTSRLTIDSDGVARFVGSVTIGGSLWNTAQSKYMEFNTSGVYGTVTISGATQGYGGLRIYDGQNNPLFMSLGLECGIYCADVDHKWLIYRPSTSAVAKTDFTMEAPAFNVSSERKLKRETGTPTDVHEILYRLRPILYQLIKDGKNAKEQIGLIAEEVREVCSWLSDGKTVSYDRLALLLLADWQAMRPKVSVS